MGKEDHGNWKTSMKLAQNHGQSWSFPDKLSVREATIIVYSGYPGADSVAALLIKYRYNGWHSHVLISLIAIVAPWHFSSRKSQILIGVTLQCTVLAGIKRI